VDRWILNLGSASPRPETGGTIGTTGTTGMTGAAAVLLDGDQLATGLALCAADGRLLRCNAALRELLGSPPGGEDALAGLLLAAGVPDPLDRLAAALAAPQDLPVRRGGRATPLRLCGHAVTGGGVLYVLHPLRESGSELARHAELQSLIAHDLRSPLAVIQGYAGLLATGQPGPLNTTQQEFLAGIDAKIAEVTRLLDDFLDLSRLEAGALELRPEAVPVAELVEQVCAEQERAAAVRQIQITRELEDPGLEVMGDPLRLTQVLENLVSNAVKYNHEGGWVRVEAAGDEGGTAIRVRDGGPGIAPEDLQAIFEPFRRAATRGEAGGSGLGLAVVQHLVQLHGGTIDAASTPGRGTCFTVRLPRRAAAPHAIANPVQ
jgi:signal transduction histidine kinase